jgi:cytochrome P450 family 71 subfamily A
VSKLQIISFSFMCFIQDMFIAGTDTTAATVEWTTTELVRHPDILAKAQQEVRGAVAGGGGDIVLESDLPRLTYLKQVIRESMRVHPPVPLLVPRESVRPSNPARCTAARSRPERGCS